MKFVEALQLCIEKNLVFAAYRLPHSDAIRLIVQKNSCTNSVEVSSEIFLQKGFLVSPYSESETNSSYLIKPDLNYLSTDYVDFDELVSLSSNAITEADFGNGSVSKKEFTNQVSAIVDAINDKQFDKAVISRIKIIERSYKSKLTDIFQLLCSSYSNAFVYLFNVAGQMWMGATPEPLICSHKNEVQTVSLAGTREFNAENLNIYNWSKKDRIEQQFVTDYIENALRKFNIEDYYKDGPYTKKAGNLIHLRTDFTIDYKKINRQLGELVKTLHPTPAVCGLQKLDAMQFLQKLEKHNRSFYSGFLGPVNLDERILLFVNLRCMRILNDRLVLYIGAGITSESIPDDEWNETEIKADTLLSVIHKV